MNACARAWGRWIFRCKTGGQHECMDPRGHVSAHRCAWCGASRAA